MVKKETQQSKEVRAVDSDEPEFEDELFEGLEATKEE